MKYIALLSFQFLLEAKETLLESFYRTVEQNRNRKQQTRAWKLPCTSSRVTININYIHNEIKVII